MNGRQEQPPAVALDGLTGLGDNPARLVELLGALFQRGPIAMCYWDRQFIVRWANDACVAIYHSTLTPIVGQSILDLAPPAKRARMRAYLEGLMTGKRPLEVERAPFIQRTGAISYWNLFQTPVRAIDGTIAGIITSAREITAHTLAHQELETERARLNLVFDSLPINIGVWDAEGRLTLRNGPAQRLWQSLGNPPRPDANGFWPTTMLDLDGWPIPHEEMPLSRVLRTGQPVTAVMQLLALPDGSLEPWVVAATPLRDDQGRLAGCVVIAHDPRPGWEHQRLAERAQSLEAVADLRSQLLAFVSHELRTPLSYISGFAAALRFHSTSLAPPDKSEYLAIIGSAAAQLGRLIDDLLDASQIESGGLSLLPGVVMLPTLAAHVIARAHALEPSRILKLSLPATFPPVPGDPGRIEQVLENLVGNALRHAPGSSITIGGRVRRQEVEIWVHDTGPGFPADWVNKALGTPNKPLERRHSSGLGLGLSICRGIVEAHGGRIWLAPRRRGAAVHFTLPRRRDRPRAVSHEAAVS